MEKFFISPRAAAEARIVMISRRSKRTCSTCVAARGEKTWTSAAGGAGNQLERRCGGGEWREGGGRGVSARVSPVVLAAAARERRRRRPHDCGYGELPRRQEPPPPKEEAVSTGGGPPLSGWHFLPRRPGTFAQHVRNVGRRAVRAAVGLLKWPFALRPYLEESSGGGEWWWTPRSARERRRGRLRLREGGRDNG